MYSVIDYFAVYRDDEVLPDVGATLTRAISEKCPVCGKPIIGTATYGDAVCRVENPTGGGLPDNLSFTHRIWSGRVVAALADAGFTGFRSSKLNLEASVGSKLPAGAGPYFAVDFEGRVPISREHFDGGDGDVCEGCGRWTPRRGGKVKYGAKTVAVEVGGGPMPDFAVGKNVIGEYALCSKRFVDMVRQSGWTGFRFTGTAPGLVRMDISSESWFEDFKDRARSAYPSMVL